MLNDPPPQPPEPSADHVADATPPAPAKLTFDQLAEAGKHLWGSDDEFYEFMASIGRPVPPEARR